MQSFNWGIIGPGSIAGKFAQAIKASTRGQIAAVASRSQTRGEEFATQYKVPKVYQDYQSLVKDTQIDIIYVATPHSFHYQQAKLCIEAGKHLLLEKPCTINAAQMTALTELAKEHKVFLQEALWSRFTPCLSQLKQQLAAGIIGDIQTIHSTIGFAFQDRPQSRLFNLALGGGALLDLGVYSITISQFLLDEHPLKIQAMGKIGPSGVDEHCLVNMQYASGRMSQFICTAHSQADNIMTIVGSRGRIVLPSCFWDVDQALVYQNNNLVMNMDIPHKINGFEYQIEASMDCIEAGRPYSELMSHADSIGVMRVMDEVRQQLGLVFDGDIEAL